MYQLCFSRIDLSIVPLRHVLQERCRAQNSISVFAAVLKKKKKKKEKKRKKENERKKERRNGRMKD